jgi:pimeloyl-ACP methyl ester carboxylesterase
VRLRRTGSRAHTDAEGKINRETSERTTEDWKLGPVELLPQVKTGAFRLRDDRLRFAGQTIRPIVLAIVVLALGLDEARVNAQTTAEAEDLPLNTQDTLRHGVVLSEAQCSTLGTAIWLHVDGRGFCVRYWISTSGGIKNEALVYIHGDVGGLDRGKAYLAGDADLSTAGRQQRNAQRWSNISGGPFISIARVGAYGSSGEHLRQRRTLLEVQVIMAALDALRERHGFKRFHIVGQSGGGHTVAAMLQMRSDLGCAVMTSGILSVKTHALDLGWPVNAKIAASYDPIEFVDAIRSRPGQRMVVISDPDDRRAPYHSQREFVERVRVKGLSVLHVIAAASHGQAHELGAVGLRLAVDCANGIDDITLIRRYQTKVPPDLASSKEQTPERP